MKNLKIKLIATLSLCFTFFHATQLFPTKETVEAIANQYLQHIQKSNIFLGKQTLNQRKQSAKLLLEGYKLILQEQANTLEEINNKLKEQEDDNKLLEEKKEAEEQIQQSFTGIINLSDKLAQLQTEENISLLPTAFSFICNAEEESDEKEILDKNSWVDFSLFSNSNLESNKTLLTEIDKTNTLLGTICLAQELVETGQQKREQNITTTQELIRDKNTSLYNELDQVLKKLNITLKNYFSYHQLLNNNPQARAYLANQLNLLGQIEHKFANYFLRPLGSSAQSLIFPAFLASLSKLFSAKTWFNSKENCTCSTNNGYEECNCNYTKTTQPPTAPPEANGFFKNIISNTPHSPSDLAKIGGAFAVEKYIQDQTSSIAKISPYMTILPSMAMHMVLPAILKISFFKFQLLTTPANLIYHMNKKRIEKNKLLAQIVPHLENTKSLISCLQELKELADQNEILSPLAIELENFFNNPNELIQTFIILANELDEKNKNNTHFVKEMYTAFAKALILDSKEKTIFSKALQSVGKLDAALSKAKLIKEQDPAEPIFNLVDFNKQAKTPHISINYGYNFLSNEQNEELLNLEIGSNQLQQIDPITIKTSAPIIYLANQFGIAPAQITMTPLDYIATSITDYKDIKIEADLLGEIRNKVTLQPQANFGLVIFDDSRLTTLQENEKPSVFDNYHTQINALLNRVFPTHNCCFVRITEQLPAAIR